MIEIPADAKPVSRLTIRSFPDGHHECGECGARVESSRTVSFGTGVLDNLSSPDARDWREIRQEWLVLSPCGHAQGTVQA